MGIGKRQEHDDGAVMPEYIKQWSGLYMRQGDRIVEALPQDIDVAKRYPSFENKGSVVDGRRITIMCRGDTYRVGEEVRIIHMHEILEPGQRLFIMGPKAVCAEFVDGVAMKQENCSEELGYDGRVLDSPGVDYNYDITSYTFSTPGRHIIYWQMDILRSNTLEIEVNS